MQYKLWEKYKDKWSPLEPKFAHDSLLWMMEELSNAYILKYEKNMGRDFDNKHSNYLEHTKELLIP